MICTLKDLVSAPFYSDMDPQGPRLCTILLWYGPRGTSYAPHFDIIIMDITMRLTLVLCGPLWSSPCASFWYHMDFYRPDRAPHFEIIWTFMDLTMRLILKSYGHLRTSSVLYFDIIWTFMDLVSAPFYSDMDPEGPRQCSILISYEHLRTSSVLHFGIIWTFKKCPLRSAL